MELPLVAGTDGSDASLPAVDWAAREAERHGLPLRVVFGSVWEHYERIKPNFSPDRSSEQVLAEHIVAAGAERAERIAPDVKVSAEVIPEDPVSALLEEGRHAYAVVVGRRGRGEVTDWLLGSTSLTVAARATCPVVVTRGDEGAAGRSGVVLGVADVGRNRAAAEFAFREAHARGTSVTAVRAWRRPLVLTREEEEDFGEEARDADIAVDTAVSRAAQEFGDVPLERRVVEGGARHALLTEARDAGLLVVGARRRTLPVGMQLGPVNHAVLHRAPCPVAVVPQQHE